MRVSSEYLASKNLEIQKYPTLLVETGDSGFAKRIAHTYRDEKCHGDNAGQVIIKPGLVSRRLEPQGDGLGRPAKNGDRNGIRQTDTRGADVSREQLGFD